MGVTTCGATFRGIAAAALLSVGLLAEAPAYAVNPALLPLGTPSAVNDGVAIDATGEIVYDSNQLRTDSNVLLAGAHRDDFRYSPSADISYNRTAARLSVSAMALAGHDFFQYNTYLDRNRFLGNGIVTYRAGSSCQAAANGNYSSRQAGVRGDIIGGPAPGSGSDVGKLISNAQDIAVYGVNAGCGSPSGKLSFNGGYSHTSVRNGSALRSFADSNGDTFTGSVGIGILRPGQVALNGSYSTIGYPNSLAGAVINSAQFRSSVRTYRIGLSVTRPIGTKLSGTFGVSYLHAEPAGGQSPYSSPAYNVALSYAAGPRLSFSLSGLRDIVASNSAGALYRVLDEILFAARYKLGNSLSVNATAGVVNNQYKNSFAIFDEPPRNNDLTATGGVSVTYAPRDLYDATLAVDQTRRTADPTLFNYNSTRITLNLAVHI